MSYAVIRTGGKQYRVAEGEILNIEVLPDHEEGEGIHFNEVLLVKDDQGVRVGSPSVPGTRVHATIVGEGRGPKIKVFKKKRRKGYRRTLGHRQDFMAVRIDRISTE